MGGDADVEGGIGGLEPCRLDRNGQHDGLAGDGFGGLDHRVGVNEKSGNKRTETEREPLHQARTLCGPFRWRMMI